MKQFAAEDIWGDLSMREYDVLYTLSKRQEPLRPGDLNRYVLLSQPALSRMVDRLTTRGLIARTPDPTDARSVLLALTETGRARQRQIGRRHAHSVTQAVASALTAEEMRQLQALSRRLAASGAQTVIDQ
jgi:DNA-binding MarR family transcriptional regulator